MEQPLGVLGVDAKGLEVGLHPEVVKVLLHLFQGHGPTAILVHFNEELAHLLHVLLLDLHLLLHEELALHSGSLHSIVHKDTSNDVEHGQDCERDVEEEERGLRPVHQQERVGHLVPAHAAQHGDDKTVDGSEEGPEPPRYTRIASVSVLVYVLGGTLREADREHVDDHGQHDEGPDEGPDGVHDHQGEQAQLPKEAEDAEDPQDPEHLDGLHVGVQPT
mmetsp:Transcript_105013/g.279397  ORF Transcript_105013/g.279397 Transcript_105013/m.279397 type:complete len:219 (+) Transcript_105013:776-1432(+)